MQSRSVEEELQWYEIRDLFVGFSFFSNGSYFNNQAFVLGRARFDFVFGSIGQDFYRKRDVILMNLIKHSHSIKKARHSKSGSINYKLSYCLRLLNNHVGLVSFTTRIDQMRRDLNSVRRKWRIGV